jgi:hypothetical protein
MVCFVCTYSVALADAKFNMSDVAAFNRYYTSSCVASEDHYDCSGRELTFIPRAISSHARSMYFHP